MKGLKKVFFSDTIPRSIGILFCEETLKSGKIESVAGPNKIHLTSDCANGINVDDVRKPIVLSIILDKVLGYKLTKTPNTKRFKKLKQSFLNEMIFYLEKINL